MNKLEIESINEKYQAKLMGKKKVKIYEIFENLEKDRERKKVELHRHYQKNIEQNKETMKAEMEFKYLGNNEEQIRYL